MQTKGSMTPFIIRVLARPYNWQVRIQHRIWTKEHYLADATGLMHKAIIRSTN